MATVPGCERHFLKSSLFSQHLLFAFRHITINYTTHNWFVISWSVSYGSTLPDCLMVLMSLLKLASSLSLWTHKHSKHS